MCVKHGRKRVRRRAQAEAERSIKFPIVFHGQNGISPGQKLKLLQGRREIVGNRADDISQTISIRVRRGVGKERSDWQPITKRRDELS